MPFHSKEKVDKKAVKAEQKAQEKAAKAAARAEIMALDLDADSVQQMRSQNVADISDNISSFMSSNTYIAGRMLSVGGGKDSAFTTSAVNDLSKLMRVTIRQNEQIIRLLESMQHV
ncbi:MAG: hypothetical protein LKF61_00955 [Eggerthellaceae bacterium]|jgi:hypothetical protein|nr:hypothetical protein [Eggerthellaceae bacterium]MCH4220464.1 hypothetical protein [Eggerthellaceae bacterium]